MKKLIAALAITSVILGIATACLFYQTSELQHLNSELKSQNSEAQNQLAEQQIRSSEFQNQILELETRIDELENRIDELENPVYDVEIVSFSVEEGWENPGGMWLIFRTNVTIQNNGNEDVRGLVLFLKRLGDVNHLLGSNYVLLDILHAGEELEVNTWIESSFDSAWAYKPIFHVATLRLGSEVIDEYTLS